MRVKSSLSAGLFLISWMMFLSPSQGAPPGVIAYGQGDYLDVSQQTWKEYPTPLKDPLGYPTRPWQPTKGEEYPWKQPYSATMLMYLATDHKFHGAKYLNYSLSSGRLNKEGLFTQKVGCGLRECIYDHYLDVMQYDEDPGGTLGTGGLMQKFFMIYHTPAHPRRVPGDLPVEVCLPEQPRGSMEDDGHLELCPQPPKDHPLPEGKPPG